ncbi:unnamed protein product [Polarella glacialis]|uniref:ABC transporter domain-containing protein n=1 Tax=Polarella glacialis TaxID=89957 RepID=A0A813KRA7_POLGL|nr:unnamed protein product [Polarella glacialis]CAE8708532.1 unnamed protein product [Polarella glacialis]
MHPGDSKLQPLLADAVGEVLTTAQPGSPTRVSFRSKFRLAVHLAGNNCHSSTNADIGSKDTVHVASKDYFAYEDDVKVVVTIFRLGLLEGTCSVHYQTVEGSAKAPFRYVQVGGEAVFRSGEFSKEIAIEIVASEFWEPNSEFQFFLSQPVNCEIGSRLHKARIRIIDRDSFPSQDFCCANKGEEEDLEACLEEQGHLKLLSAFLWLVICSIPGLGWRTVVVLIFDQLPNLYIFLTLSLQVYLVDVVFNSDPSPSQKSRLFCITGPADGVIYTAFFVSFLYTAPLLVLHLWSVAKSQMDVGGCLQEYLQNSVFVKYMNYNKRSRDEVPAVHIEAAINEYVTESTECFMRVVEMVQINGKLFIMAFFIIGENETAILPLVVLPSAMLIFILCRASFLVGLRESCVDAGQRLRDMVHESAAAHNVIITFQMRSYMCQTFENLSRQLASANKRVSANQTLNEFFPKWVGTIIISCYLAWAAPHVVDKTLSLGKVLATIRVFGELIEQLTEGYTLLMNSISGFGPLQKLTEVLNKETDLTLRRELSMKNQDLTVTAFVDHLSEASRRLSAEERVDSHALMPDLPIQITDLSYRYPQEEFCVFQNVSLSVPQGSFVAIVGGAAVGKTTLLHLLAQIIQPLEGHVFVPCHIRTVLVGADPIILKLSAWKNLTFGSDEIEPSRVRRILSALKMDQTLNEVNRNLKKLGLSTLKTGMSIHLSVRDTGICVDQKHLAHTESIQEVHNEETAWIHRITRTEKAKLHLARALIANPEVLLLDRPFLHYGPEDAVLVEHVLKEFVRQRGFMMPGANLKLRRPRTCFFSPVHVNYVHEADFVLQLHRPLASHGFISVIPHGQVVEKHVE